MYFYSTGNFNYGIHYNQILIPGQNMKRESKIKIVRIEIFS